MKKKLVFAPLPQAAVSLHRLGDDLDPAPLFGISHRDGNFPPLGDSPPNSFSISRFPWA